MALGELQGILAALQQSHQRRMAQAQLANEQAQQASLDAYRQQAQKAQQQQLQLDQQRLDDEHSHNQQVLDTTKQLRRLQLYEEQQKLTQQYQKDRTLPPGGQFVGGGNTTTGGQYQLPSYSGFNDDSGNPTSIQIPSQADLLQTAKNQADIQRVQNMPQEEMLQREQEAKAYQAQIQAKENAQYRAEQAAQHDKDLQTIAQMHNSTLQTVAQMRLAGNGSAAGTGVPDNDTIAQQVTGLLNGSLTKEDLKKVYTGKLAPQYTNIVNLAAKQGIPLSDAQRTQLNAIQQHVRNIGVVDDAIGNMPNTEGYISSYLNAPSLMANQNFNSDVKQLNANLPATTISQSGSKRFQKYEAGLVGGGYIPSVTTPKTEAIMNRDKTVDALNKWAEDVIPGATPAQITGIKHQIGLDQLTSWNTKQQSQIVSDLVKKHTLQQQPQQPQQPVGQPPPSAVPTMTIQPNGTAQ